MRQAVEPLQGTKEIVEYDRKSAILLKGTGYGVRMTFPDSAYEEELFDQIRRFPLETAYLSGGLDAVFDFQGRSLSKEFLLRMLSEFVWPNGIRVLGWLSYDLETRALLRAAGFATEEPGAGHAESGREAPGSLVLTQSLRCGQRVEYDGDVVVLGHVNEGAEVYASGNVFVRGRLKGVVHAGVDGGERCVSAGSFEAAQVRLGDKICSSLGDDLRWKGKSVLFSVEDGSLIARELKV